MIERLSLILQVGGDLSRKRVLFGLQEGAGAQVNWAGAQVNWAGAQCLAPFGLRFLPVVSGVF